MAKAVVIPIGKELFESYSQNEWEDQPEFSKLFAEQVELMKQIGFPNLDLDYDELIEEVVHCVGSEAAEMSSMFLVKTKPWKEFELINVEHLFEESIDVLHFLLELWILLGLSPQQVFDEYISKNIKNRKRIEEKMSNQPNRKLEA